MLFIKTLGKLLPLEPSTWRLLAGLIACSSLISPNAIAQIIPDNTLGDESSVVVPDVEINGVNSDRLEGGAVRGNNLFHSFQEFNIDAGRGAYFANPAAIENIFSRVTGVNPSEIFGTLGVLGNANLFLLNPNGIIFGENASLDLRGSFVGTTADSIVFPDGQEFSATNPGLPPLLTVNVEQPIGLKFEGESGIITNAADLAVGSRQTLSLSGNEVSTTGNLTAPGGRVEVLGTETVALLEDGTIDVSSDTGGGTVLIGGDFQGRGTVPNGKRTYVDNNFTIKADALTNGNGGRVIVWADEVTGFYGNISARGGLESGDGGLVEVSGKEHLIFRGNADTSAVNGLPGTLLLDPTNIIIADGSGDEAGDGTDTFAGNNSGTVGSILTAPLSEIDDTVPTTIYESELEGLSGDTNIILQATNNITLQDLSDDGLDLAAGEGVIAFSADADKDGVGDFVMEDNVADTIFTNGRDIAISGANLSIGNIDTSVLVVGDAGELVETALFVSDTPGEALESISGNISSTEDVDLFQIYLTGEGTFSATTVNPETTLDTQLFLFDADGLGIYANEDQAGCNCFQATLPAGDVLTPTEPGVYYLGISTFGDNAVSSGGEIFPSSSEAGFEAIKTPTGDGGLLPLSAWIGGLEQGSYKINLTGVEAAETTVLESIQPIGNSGSINLNATGDININGIVDTSGNLGNSGAVNITAKSVFLTNGARILSRINKKGNGRAISITATEAISLSGENSQGGRSGIFSELARGTTGKAGDINIETGSFSLSEGAEVSATTFGVGDAGAIQIIATDSISLLGEDNDGFGSGIFSQVQPKAEGKAGGITVKTDSLFLTNGAQLSATTFGVGDAGAIQIIANKSISLSGEDTQGFTSGIFSQVIRGAQGTAGEIRIETGSLSLADGAGVITNTNGRGNAGLINITATDAITITGEDSQGDVSGIFSQVESEAEGNAGGITIETGSLTLTDRAKVSANTEGDGKAGDIFIIANTIQAINRGQIETNTTNKFKAADITLEISDNIFLSGTDSGLFAQTEGVGNAGNIIIDTSQLTIDEGAEISAFTTANGDGGTITVNAPQEILLTDNSQLTVETSGAGRPGDITITTPNLTIGKDAEISATATATSTNTERGGSITINASNLDLTGKLGIFAETQGETPAGTLNIQPDENKPNLDIQFTDTAIISASTTASGQGGDINLIAPVTINISGQGKVAVETTGTGNAGSINITTQNLNLSQQTEISASTFSSSLAGDINITANNFNLTEGATVITNTSSSGQAGDIELQIRDELNLVDSSITASTDINSTGRGGNININRPNLTLINSEIEVNSQGEGIGGDITLQADTLTLENQSAITAETVSTDGGEIKLNVGDNLVLRDNSQISATAGTAQAGGNGGNVDINAQFILAFPTEDSNITANAFQGNGGEISITAEGILGIEFREQPTILSDITASSEFGLAGTVDIDTPETDPNRGLVTLPQQAVDTQVALGCDVDGEGAVAFYDLGRGGLSTSPDDFLIPDTVIGEWLPLIPSLESFAAPQKLNFEVNGQQRATGIKQFVPPCWR
ncbi:MAG: filamentous hemagglutinin N-terminal domain-containing protein [Xenococcaceae cyanobacterium MO_207.B15]|nr:filamentous hemagglutinin N-terminal domain-containing protein [Xenococcaceae cyanobacterium MO_207.B15]